MTNNNSPNNFRPGLTLAVALAVLSLLAACSSDTNPGRFTVSGTVTGLSEGNAVVLQNNGIDDLVVSDDGTFTFNTPLVHNAVFDVTIRDRPDNPGQTCLIDNGSGRMPGGNLGNIEVTCFRDVVLRATPGDGRINVSWNSQDFPASSFTLCQASETISAGIDNCTAHDGGVLVANATSPYDTGELALDTPYWFLLEAEHPDGRRTQSNLLPRSIPTGLDEPVRILNDTGIDWCADDGTNYSTGGAAERTQNCEAVAATHPGQDGEFGRDAALRAGELVKIGSGAVSFDYTRICNNGEVAGEGGCPEGAVVGNAPNNWGCTRDNVTGLIWEVKQGINNHLRSANHLYSWFDPNVGAGNNPGVQNGGFCAATDGSCETNAFNTDTHAFVQAVNEAGLCGANDWRLPTVDELNTLTHRGAESGPAISANRFPGTASADYWTATTIAGFSDEAWRINFANGDDRRDAKSEAHRIRLVRRPATVPPAAPANAADIPGNAAACASGSLPQSTPSTDFTAIEDGSIIRHVPTGLEWQRCALGQNWDGDGCSGAPLSRTWQQALIAANAMASEGWRLPNVNELRTLVERCSITPAINRQAFPDAPAAAFMSSTPSARDPDRVWVIHFISGNSNRIDKGAQAEVRLVRDSQ